MFNIYLYQEGQIDLPNDDICYIITKNGILLKKKIGIMESIIPVDKISILGDITPYAKMNIPKISKKDFANIINFFKEVYRLYKSEANIIIHYNNKLKKYILQVPKQEVSMGSVIYLNNIQYDGYNRVGTIHSHASMGAFHSGIDDSDENNWDGFHFTIGNLDNKYVSISSSIVVNGKRFEVEPKDYIEEIKYNSIKVKKQPNRISFFDIPNNNGYYIEDGEKYKFPSTWLDFIDKKTYQKYYKEIFKNKSQQHNISHSMDNLDLFSNNQFKLKGEIEDNDPCKYCCFRKDDEMEDDEMEDDEMLENNGLFDKDIII